MEQVCSKCGNTLEKWRVRQRLWRPWVCRACQYKLVQYHGLKLRARRNEKNTLA